MSSDPSPSRLSALKILLPTLLLIAVAVAVIGCKPKAGQINLGNNGAPRDVVTVFFSKYQGNTSIVEEVVRQLPPTLKDDPLKFALTELLKGPTPEEKSQGFYSEIPQGTKLLGISEKGDTLTINLSGQFESGGGSNSMGQRFEEVRQTVFSVDSRHQVSLAVEGRLLETLGGEGLEVQQELKRKPQ